MENIQPKRQIEKLDTEIEKELCEHLTNNIGELTNIQEAISFIDKQVNSYNYIGIKVRKFYKENYHINLTARALTACV